MQDALQHLKWVPIPDWETRERVRALRDSDRGTDREAYRAWRRGFIRTNLGPIAHRYLDAYEAVVVPPLPSPRSENE